VQIHESSVYHLLPGILELWNKGYQLKSPDYVPGKSTSLYWYTHYFNICNIQISKEIPWSQKPWSIRVVLGVGCVAVFSRTLDHRSYQDDDPSPSWTDYLFRHRNKTLFSDIWTHSMPGNKGWWWRPLLIFRMAYFISPKHSLCYSQHVHQHHSRISETVPTDKLKNLSAQTSSISGEIN